MSTEITLSDDDVERAKSFCEERVKRFTRDKGETLPWRLHELNEDEIRAWRTSRKEVAKRIDPATCEIDWWYANLADPYGVRKKLGELPPEEYCVGRVDFVRSPESRGWVVDDDLPDDIWDAVSVRIKRERIPAPLPRNQQ